jgi:oxygen-independent coproporphyrinogen-3 oxidase
MGADAMARFRAALAREIDLLAALPWAGHVTVATVFLGGGTPSLLAGDEMHALLDHVRDRLRVDAGAEVSVECNPESVDRAKLGAYRAAGVTRISLGVQSLDDAILPRLGRLHVATGARVAFDAARAAGFDNVSVDLMYGLPGLDASAFERATHAILEWEPDHLSAYGLSLDAGSLWGSQGVDDLPEEDVVIAQYWTLARAAAARGYEHYEVSNYARPGFRSQHNLTYWRAAEYLACGPGGCGFIGDVRYGNVKPVPRYCATLEDGALPIDTSETLTPRQRQAERLILGLRTADGVPTAWVAERVHGDAPLARRLDTWRAEGLLVDNTATGHTCLTEKGFLLSDALFVELL